MERNVLEEISDPLTVILKNLCGKIGTSMKAKVDNGKDYRTKTKFIDQFMAEIFIPIGRFNEMLKTADQGSFR